MAQGASAFESCSAATGLNWKSSGLLAWMASARTGLCHSNGPSWLHQLGGQSPISGDHQGDLAQVQLADFLLAGSSVLHLYMAQRNSRGQPPHHAMRACVSRSPSPSPSLSLSALSLSLSLCVYIFARACAGACACACACARARACVSVSAVTLQGTGAAWRRPIGQCAAVCWKKAHFSTNFVCGILSAQRDPCARDTDSTPPPVKRRGATNCCHLPNTHPGRGGPRPRLPRLLVILPPTKTTKVTDHFAHPPACLLSKMTNMTGHFAPHDASTLTAQYVPQQQL